MSMDRKAPIPLAAWGNIFLAPMAGVTDRPFRLLCREKGASLVYTEMVSAKAMHYKDKKTFEIARTHPDEMPMAFDLGHEPDIMAEAAAWFSNSPISPLSTLIWANRLPRSSKTERVPPHAQARSGKAYCA